MNIRINWIYEGEAGYWRSVEGRFTVSPGGFRHGVTPDFFELRDVNLKPKNNTNRFDTVGAAKSAAITRCIAELKAEYII